MRVREQAPCLVEFFEEAARPSGEVGPVRPQLRFSGSRFSESSICFLSPVWGVGVRDLGKIERKLLIGGEIKILTEL